ncbi:hypothetical protein A4A49_30829 [Nicotiana attenuata]|uniref:Uncharacterized protein n=1 Tax=Nicotiana attenuata TaxID=49451 RepID=A0A1J6HY91_NICAT|nr:hypothetical protein A4A49_30829 [Nicotiana attenuata]
MANLLARAAAIPSWAKINTSSSPQYWKKHSDSNNLNLAYEVFEKMSGNIRDNEAVVETSELLEKHIDVASTYNVSTGSHVEVELLKNMEILDELQASNVLVTKKEEFLDEDHVFNEMPNNCDSTVLAVASDLEDGNSEVDQVLDGNPKRTIDKNYVSPTDAATNFLVPFTSGEDIVQKVIASPSQVTHPFENVILLHIPRSPCLWNFFDKKFMMAHEVSDIERELVVSSSGARSIRLAYPFPCGGRESVAPIIEQVAGTFVLGDRDPWTGGALVSTTHRENFWTPKCKLLLLLESTGRFCSYASSFSIIKVWDPERQWCVNSYYSEIIGNIIIGLEISDISLKKCDNADQVEGSEFSWFGLHSPTYALTWVTAEPSSIADPVATSNQMLGSPHVFYNTLGYSIHFVVAQDLYSCCSTMNKIEQRHTSANDEQ